ncbi:seryl-tRNA synthetase [Mycobacterium xenopi 3993]|nr:seryl-tRNA synthetase [Mycobacterium xenopi 3993]
MIDLRLLRDDPETVRRSQISRGEDPGLVDVLLAADAARRTAISRADSLRAEQKAASKKVGAASAAERPALLQQAKELAEQVKAAEAVQADAEAAFTAAHMAISNVILDGVPAGGEEDYTVLDVVGEPAGIENPRDHLELGESLGLIDMARGAKVSGSRFYFLTGRGALLQLGLLQLALRLAVDNGFIPLIPPVLVRPQVMSGTGFLARTPKRCIASKPTTCIWWAPPRCRWPATTATRSWTCRAGHCATWAGRRVFDAKPAVTARTPAASSGCISSTRWKGSSTACPTTPRPNTSGCWAGSARCWPASRCPIA